MQKNTSVPIWGGGVFRIEGGFSPCYDNGNRTVQVMIRNLIFDMGEVLLHFDRAYFIRRLGISGADANLLMDQVFYSLEWVLLDRGAMEDPEAIESICRRLPEHLHPAVEALVSHWDEPILPVAGMEELIGECKALGYPVYLLSNASLRQHDYWNRIPGSAYFDGKLISADVKLLKPQPEIYHLLYERFQIRPEESFFIDDSPNNIEGAYQTGMPGFVFRGDVNALRNRLRTLGLPVKS